MLHLIDFDLRNLSPAVQSEMRTAVTAATSCSNLAKARDFLVERLGQQWRVVVSGVTLVVQDATDTSRRGPHRYAILGEH